MQVKASEREIMRQAYLFFSHHSEPPVNHDVTAVAWWSETALEAGQLDAQWRGHPLMRKMLLAIYEYLDYKAVEKTKEVDDVLQEL